MAGAAAAAGAAAQSCAGQRGGLQRSHQRLRKGPGGEDLSSFFCFLYLFVRGVVFFSVFVICFLVGGVVCFVCVCVLFLCFFLSGELSVVLCLFRCLCVCFLRVGGVVCSPPPRVSVSDCVVVGGVAGVVWYCCFRFLCFLFYSLGELPFCFFGFCVFCFFCRSSRRSFVF